MFHLLIRRLATKLLDQKHKVDKMRLLELLDNNEEPKKSAPSREPKMIGTTKGMSADQAAALPNAAINRQLRNTDTYLQYRYGVALAAAAAHEGSDEFEQESAWAENIGLVGYSDEEMEQIKAADKLMGVTSDVVTDGSGSHEVSSVNTKSAISGAENQ